MMKICVLEATLNGGADSVIIQLPTILSLWQT